MTTKEYVNLLYTELSCVMQSDTCDRKCGNCKLARESSELIEMYNDVAGMLERGEVGAMTANDYQTKAARTINRSLSQQDMTAHALYGLAAEVGELLGIHQKVYQGHNFDEEHAKKEMGDILWMCAEYCTAHDWMLADVMRANIEKLRERYPMGFESGKSLHRKEGDI